MQKKQAYKGAVSFDGKTQYSARDVQMIELGRAAGRKDTDIDVDLLKAGVKGVAKYLAAKHEAEEIMLLADLLAEMGSGTFIKPIAERILRDVRIIQQSSRLVDGIKLFDEHSTILSHLQMRIDMLEAAQSNEPYAQYLEIIAQQRGTLWTDILDEIRRNSEMVTVGS